MWIKIKYECWILVCVRSFTFYLLNLIYNSICKCMVLHFLVSILVISSTVNNAKCVQHMRMLSESVCVFGRLVIEVTFDMPLLSVKTDKALQSNLSSASFSEMLLHASLSLPYPINIPHFKQTAAVPCSSAFAHFYANFCLFCTLFCHKFHTLKGFLHHS